MNKASESHVKSLLLSQTSFLLLFIIVLGVLVAIINPNFRNIRNIINIFQQVSVLGIMSAGIGMLLISGEFDISIGSQLSVIGVVMAMIIEQKSNIPFSIVAALLIGLVLGVINGITVVKSKAASFIITLGFMVAYKGLALVISHGYAYRLKGQFTYLGRGRIMGILPIQVIVYIVVILIAYAILRYTKYGRLLYAIGGNREAAYVSGIKTERNIIVAYAVVGILNGLAALVLISQLGAAYPNTGDPFALNALAAVVVGGTAITGGKGSALGIFLGVLTFGLISNALNVLNVNAYWREVVLGLIIISAVTISKLSLERE
jgi:ribose transport system permease protein